MLQTPELEIGRFDIEVKTMKAHLKFGFVIIT
jgi:hypothetical protein